LVIARDGKGNQGFRVKIAILDDNGLYVRWESVGWGLDWSVFRKSDPHFIQCAPGRTKCGEAIERQAGSADEVQLIDVKSIVLTNFGSW
jgi:hypothetical protein